jgi:hypothetical protein
MTGPRRREAAGGHSISSFFGRLSPFPFAGVPIVAGDAALDHFIAPLIACDDECGEIPAAEANGAESDHNENLQRQLVHDRPRVAPVAGLGGFKGTGATGAT